ncbi:hypothetical protein [Candidatus Hodarchaeum mangrovi]
MRLKKPILAAARVIKQWPKQFKSIYITGRLERIKTLTFSELKRFGFPIQDSRLYMIEREDQVFIFPFSYHTKRAVITYYE